MLVLVCGLPGTGKSTVAERVADLLSAERLRTDVVRKELFPEPTYAAAESATVYDELFSRARETLASNEHVVLDATFRRRELRERAAALAHEADTEYQLVRVACEESVVRERIRKRQTEEDDESDADFDIYTELKAEFEPIEGDDHMVIDNSGPLVETLAAVDDAFRAVAAA
ncbi:AAA family ATPase [Halolamina salifodinae]|uniref:Putative kinase n=1 Tax=Halolamina salifodinae TaxID=1202767 RepID=A0A8T4GY00_9EURY|nr:AAA family ATPase [Halolamina salifodinae]MBP1987879.1 putative kinase [Halolamina salifodinae]